MNWANYVITGLGIVGCLTFIAGYWYLTSGAWIREEPGRFLMSYTVTVLVLLVLVIVGPFPYRRLFLTFMYAAFVGTLWWPLRLLWVAQRQQKNDKP